MLLRTKVPMMVLGVAAALIGLASWGSYTNQLSRIRDAEDTRLELVAAIFDDALGDEARRALAIADGMATLPSVRAHLRSGARDLLKAELAATWDKLHGNHGLDVMQFTVSPGTVFLRMHNPGKFGDDASARAMVMLALGRGEPQSGIEVGSSGARVRGIVQVTDDAGAIGVTEIGMGFDPVLERVKTLTGFEMAAYLRQEGEPPSDARVLGSHRELASTNREAIATVLDPQHLDGVQQVERTREDVGGERYGLVRLPLRDFSGNQLGVVVGTRSFADTQGAERDALRNAIVVALVQIVVLAGAVLLAFNALLVRPVQRLAERVAAGKGTDAELAARQDEVGALARAVGAVAPTTTSGESA